MIFVADSVKNIVGKGENAGNQHFFPFPTMFSKTLAFRVVKIQDCLVKTHIDKNACEHIIENQSMTMIAFLYHRNECFRVYPGISLSVRLSVCLSVYLSMYKILVILCHKHLLQFYCYCIESLLIH